MWSQGTKNASTIERRPNKSNEQKMITNSEKRLGSLTYYKLHTHSASIPNTPIKTKLSIYLYILSHNKDLGLKQLFNVQSFFYSLTCLNFKAKTVFFMSLQICQEKRNSVQTEMAIVSANTKLCKMSLDFQKFIYFLIKIVNNVPGFLTFH